MNGTGYSDTSGCVTVYENETDDYDAFGCSEASSAGSDKYIDILSSSERANLTRTVSLAEGTYNYGLINWYKPIKVTGSITRNNNTTLYTKSGTCVPNAGNPYTLASSDMTTSSAEESIVALNNGGSFFKFQTPFSVVADGSYSVDLAFNYDRLLKAGANGSNAQIRSDSNGANAIYVPILDIAPIPRSSSDVTKLETYTMTGPSEYNVRLEIYYRGSDTSKSIMAASLSTLYTTATNQNILSPPRILTFSESGGNYTFKDWQNNTILTFGRSATGGTATFICPQEWNGGPCTAGASINLNYSAPSITSVSN